MIDPGVKFEEKKSKKRCQGGRQGVCRKGEILGQGRGREHSRCMDRTGKIAGRNCMIPATKCTVEGAFPGVIAFSVDTARTVGNGDVGVVGVVESFIVERSLSKEFWSELNILTKSSDDVGVWETEPGQEKREEGEVESSFGDLGTFEG